MLTLQFPDDGAAVVIGGTGGIGQSICTRLAAAGSHVALTYRRNAPLAADISRGVEASARLADSASIDVLDSAAVKAGFDRFRERFGRIHTVVYTTAPEIHQQWLSETDPAQFAASMNVNVQGLFNVMHAAIPHLRRSGGSLVTVTSSAAHRYPRRDSLSSIPKAATEMLTLGLAKEEGRYGVRANCVAPHVIEIPGGARMHREVSEAVIAQMKRDIPMQRFGAPNEVADAVVYLASPLASYISGQVLVVDGGWQV